MDLKKLLGALSLLMFLIGGIACSSSEEEIITDGSEEVISEDSDYAEDDFVEDSFEDDGFGAEGGDDIAVDEGFDDSYDDSSSDYADNSYADSTIEEPVQEIAEDTSFQDVGNTDYSNDVSLGSSSSGLGK